MITRPRCPAPRRGRSIGPVAIAVALVALLAFDVAPVEGRGVASTPSGYLASAAGAPPGLTLSGYPTEGPAPLLVHFNATLPNGPAPNLSWSFGDGSYLNASGGTDRTPAHLYGAPGNYTCHLEATWSTGSENETLPILVRASTLSAELRASPTSGTAPLTVTFNATVLGGSGTYLQFLWSFGDGGVGSGLSLKYTYSSSGSYRTNFTVVDTNGGSARASVWVNVSAAPGHPPSGTRSDPRGGTNVSNGSGGGTAANGPDGGTFRFLSWTVPVAGVSVALALGVLLAVAIWSARSRRHLLADPDPTDLGAEAPAAETEAGAPDLDPAIGGLADEGAPGGEVGALEPGRLARDPPPERSPLSGGQQLTFRIVHRLATLPRVGATELPTREMTQAGLAEALGVKPSVVSRVMRRLEAAGLVSSARTHVPGFQRTVRAYRLTARGERLGQVLRESPGSEEMASPDPSEA